MDSIETWEGFHPFEEVGFAWVQARVAKIRFAAPNHMVRLRLDVYRCSRDYPLDDVSLYLNCTLLTHRVTIRDDRWSCLISEPFLAKGDRMQELQIRVPLFVPAPLLDPDAIESRSLSFALARLNFEDAN